MNSRRRFLLRATPLLLSPRLSFSVSGGSRDAEKFLGKDWRLPRDGTVEIRPVELGLDLAKIMAAVADWTIPASSRLVIRLPDGEHAISSQVIAANPDGDRLSIIGNVSRPDRCRVIWERKEDAFYAALGRCFGMVDGVTVEHARPADRGAGSAFLADAGGTVRCGAAVRVRGFYYGFQARHGGAILCRGTQCFGGGDANYFAFSGGHLHAEGSLAESAADWERGLGSGFVAEYGGTINAMGAVARYNALAGFTALSNGAIRAYGSLAEMNGKAGYATANGGVIVAHQGIARNNCGEGVIRNGSAAPEAIGNHFAQKDNRPGMPYCPSNTTSRN